MARQASPSSSRSCVRRNSLFRATSEKALRALLGGLLAKKERVGDDMTRTWCGDARRRPGPHGPWRRPARAASLARASAGCHAEQSSLTRTTVAEPRDALDPSRPLPRNRSSATWLAMSLANPVPRTAHRPRTGTPVCRPAEIVSGTTTRKSRSRYPARRSLATLRPTMNK